MTYLPRGHLNIRENIAKSQLHTGRSTTIFPVGPQRKYLLIIGGGGGGNRTKENNLQKPPTICYLGFFG